MVLQCWKGGGNPPLADEAVITLSAQGPAPWDQGEAREALGLGAKLTGVGGGCQDSPVMKRITFSDSL